MIHYYIAQHSQRYILKTAIIFSDWKSWRSEDNIKTYFKGDSGHLKVTKKKVKGCQFGSFGPGWESKAGFENKVIDFGFMKGREFRYQLSHYQLLKNDFVARS
jgi:phenylalanyl-tRNA synthetase beta subunit